MDGPFCWWSPVVESPYTPAIHCKLDIRGDSTAFTLKLKDFKGKKLRYFEK